VLRHQQCEQWHHQSRDFITHETRADMELAEGLAILIAATLIA
jgi:hypothetical protein